MFYPAIGMMLVFTSFPHSYADATLRLNHRDVTVTFRSEGRAKAKDDRLTFARIGVPASGHCANALRLHPETSRALGRHDPLQ